MRVYDSNVRAERELCFRFLDFEILWPGRIIVSDGHMIWYTLMYIHTYNLDLWEIDCHVVAAYNSIMSNLKHVLG